MVSHHDFITVSSHNGQSSHDDGFYLNNECYLLVVSMSSHSGELYLNGECRLIMVRLVCSEWHLSPLLLSL